jgi:uncharacterized protein (DUF58 family)
LNASYVLYLILFLGSLAFGLEAMLLGLGGQMSVLYRRNKRKTIALALAFGLMIVGSSAATAAPLRLEPLYVCVLVLGYTFLVGAVIWNFRTKFMTARELPPPQIASDAEIKSVLEKRGFEAMVKKKKK